jgi:hypothetical protein
MGSRRDFPVCCPDQMPWVDIHAEFVVAASEVPDERMLALITRAERNCFKPRIGRSRAFRSP